LVLAGIAAFAVFHPKAFLITAAACVLGGCLITVPAGMLMVVWSTKSQRLVRFAAEAKLAAPDMAAAREMAKTTSPKAPAMGPAADSAPAAASEATPPPRVRHWFPETLLWRPELITDDRGQATVEVDLADSITTWRLSASAVSAAGQLGGGDFPLKVFQPFFVDLNLPVSLTRNDEVGVPLVVYNYLDKPQTVKLVVKREAWFEDAVRRGSPDPVTDGARRGSPDPAAGRPQVSGAQGDLRSDEVARSGDRPQPAGDRPQPAGDRPQPGENPGQIELSLELKPNEIRSLSLPIKVLKVGQHQLEVTATGSGVADAIRRDIEVVPDGQLVDRVASGALSQPFEMPLAVPAGAIEGSVRAIVKLYPSTFSQVVEGLDAIFRMPSGCFEQTSSTTYPNVLALDYLRRTKKSVPEVEAKARQYIHTGCQRLVSFEVAGGGFDWFGHPPANRTLTAYGLMEFTDMARVHDVDPKLIDRTRNWLLAQRKPDGSWPNEARMLNDGLAGSVNRGENLDLAATAYIAWAVFGGDGKSGAAGPTLDFLLAHAPESIQDAYLLAVTTNAIAAIDRQNGRLGSYLARLDAMKKVSEDGKRAWWERAAGARTMFHGAGQAGDIETTAMSALALLNAGQYAGTARGALTWLIEHKDPRGTWHSTQATVLSLKALLAGTGAALGEEKERRIAVALGGETVREVVIPVDQAEVMQQLNLSDQLRPGNEYRLTLTDKSDTAVGYQVTFRYHVEKPAETVAPKKEALSISIQYDRERLRVDETVTAVARVVNNMQQAAPMVILDLPIPGGFALEAGELDELVGSQRIARYQITARQAIVYFRQLDPGQSLELRYRLRATMPVKVAVPAAQAYEYYDPSRTGQGGAARLEAVGA
jgi:uncharacterized protein YfaS (alpha-2-macroglobulin family)